MSATSETRVYWSWNPQQQKFVEEFVEYPRVELEEGEISEEPQFSPAPQGEGEEEECVWCSGCGVMAYGFDDVKDCSYCGGAGTV